MSFSHLQVPLESTVAEIANEMSRYIVNLLIQESSIDTIQYSQYPTLSLPKEPQAGQSYKELYVFSFFQLVKDTLNTPPDLFLPHSEYRISCPTRSAISFVEWHPQLPLIAIARSSGVVYFYDLRIPAYLPCALNLDTFSNISTMAFSSKNTIAAGSDNGTIAFSTLSLKPSISLVYPMQITLNPKTLGNVVGCINSLDFDSSGRLLAISTSKSGLWIYDILFHQSFRLHDTPVSSSKWSSPYNFIAVCTKSSILIYSYIHTHGLVLSSPLKITPQSKSPKLNSIQWHSDGKTLFYTLIDEPDVRIAYIYPSSIPGETPAFIHQKSISTPFTSSDLMTYGGPISRIALDPTSERLVVSFTTSNLLASFFIRAQSAGSTTDISIPLGLIRGKDSFKPVDIKFAGKFDRGALLATVWDNSTVVFTPMYFLSGQTAFNGDRIWR